METDHDAFKRQLSGGSQVAVMQAPRPMPNLQGESFQHGSNVMDYAKANFRTLGPPSKDEERRVHTWYNYSPLKLHCQCLP